MMAISLRQHPFMVNQESWVEGTEFLFYSVKKKKEMNNIPKSLL